MPPKAQGTLRQCSETNTMPETVTVEGSPVAKVAAVSASALAQRFDCTRTYIGKLEAECVVPSQRTPVTSSAYAPQHRCRERDDADAPEDAAASATTDKSIAVGPQNLVSLGFSLFLQPQDMRPYHIKPLFSDIAEQRAIARGQSRSDLRPVLSF